MNAMDDKSLSITSFQGSIILIATLELSYLILSTKYFTDIMLSQT